MPDSYRDRLTRSKQVRAPKMTQTRDPPGALGLLLGGELVDSMSERQRENWLFLAGVPKRQ